MSISDTSEKFVPIDARPAPSNQVGAVAWMRENLFSSITNTILTLLGVALILWLLPPVFNWAIFEAVISGTTKEACAGAEGACWTFVKVRFDQFMYGFYPEEERWRINIAAIISAVLIVWLVIEQTPHKKWVGIFALLPFPVICFFLFKGGYFGLVSVDTADWGGFFLSVVVSMTGILTSLPLGVLLALGRRSEMPVIRLLSTIFIEVIRGVPLISLLFMASNMLPLFAPEGVSFDKLLRALVVVALFASAYMAEVVRGGLQAIPKGQYEAASALGLGYWKSTIFITMPQALKLVIPGIVNTFIGLFKDTTLVSIIGLLDLLGIVNASLRDKFWQGFDKEGYVFIAIVFWIFCFGMSRYSIYLENKLDTGHKKR